MRKPLPREKLPLSVSEQRLRPLPHGSRTRLTLARWRRICYRLLRDTSAREVLGSFRLSPQNEEADDADTGHCGPEAFWALDHGGIQVAVGVTGTVHDALE